MRGEAASRFGRWSAIGLVSIGLGVACSPTAVLSGPQPRGLPCATGCDAGLGCEGDPALPFQTCARRCDAGCLGDEICNGGVCREACTLATDCDDRALMACSSMGDAGVCMPVLCFAGSVTCGARSCTAGSASPSPGTGKPVVSGVCVKNE